MLKKSCFVLIVLLLLCFRLQAQQRPQPLPEVERELNRLAIELLNSSDIAQKKKENKNFSRLLIETLKRSDSYNYAFDSLKTISILQPADNSFRLFTWHIVDREPNVMRGEQFYYYFGIIQRRYQDPLSGAEEIVVIPLLEMPEVPGGVENMLLDNNQWLGAQYYPIKGHAYLPKLTFKIRYAKKKENVYVLGQGMGAQPQKRKQDAYLLLGWNGNDNRTNYKVVEILSFDPQKKDRVLFGMGVFYFDQLVAKQRAVFVYSDDAAFTLNMAYVKNGMRKEEMIVYDHLGQPFRARKDPALPWELGADGSYDALKYVKSGGYFRWYRNVELAESYSRQALLEAGENKEKILRARLDELKQQARTANDETALAEIEKLEAQVGSSRQIARYLKKEDKRQLAQLEAQRRREAERMREAGMPVQGGGKAKPGTPGMDE